MVFDILENEVYVKKNSLYEKTGEKERELDHIIGIIKVYHVDTHFNTLFTAYLRLICLSATL